MALDVAGAAPAIAPHTCTPHLRITTELLSVDRSSGLSPRYEEVSLPVIELSFDYAGIRLPAQGSDDPCDRAFIPEQGAMRVLVRDARAESAARLVLEQLGAVDLECLESHAADPDSAANYLVSLEEDPSAYCAFLAEGVPHLCKQGFMVEVDEAFPYRVLEGEVQWFSEVDEDDERPNWFQLELGVEIDGSRVNLVPVLLRLLDNAGELPSLRAAARGGQRQIAVPVEDRGYVRVEPDRLQRLWRVLLELYESEQGQPVADGFPGLRAGALDGLNEALADVDHRPRWQGVPELASIRSRLDPEPPPLDNDELPVRATLRPYQLAGVAWLQQLTEQNLGGVLADDMGLGKTLQTITHLALEHRGARTLEPSMVVCPKSLVGNWERELARFAPQLRVCVVQGPHRAAAMARMGGADLILTTYPILGRELDAFAAQPLHLLVLDEAQAIKNRGSGAHASVCELDAKHRLCLSGTPVENHLRELFAMFDFLNPGLLGDERRFMQSGRSEISPWLDETRLAAIHASVRPFILRRTKEEVAPELPPKTRVRVPVELTGKQRELYESIRASAHDDVRRAIRKKGIDRCAITVLDALLKLRQLCCDPGLVKLDAARFVRESAKYERLMELLEAHREAGRRVLIFSQFTTMLSLIEQGLRQRGFEYVTLTGDTANRQAKVDAFERGDADVFLLSLKAGGTGLNLTSADTVIHYDPWWNPAAQDQATDRAYRIGQTKPVLVQELIVAGSVEERIVELQRKKRALAHALLHGPGQSGTGTRLSEAEVEQLFAPLGS